MRVCNICGSYIQDNYYICPNCGNNKITVQSNVQAPPVYQQLQVNQIPNVQEKTNMPMTFATVYIIIEILGILSLVPSIFNDFNKAVFCNLVFSCCIVYLLYKRTKIGRILVLIQNIFEIILSIIMMLIGILFFLGFSLIDIEYMSFGLVIGGIFIFLGLGVFIFSLCSFIYFKKRACMYTN